MGNVGVSFRAPRNRATGGMSANLYLFEVVQDTRLARATRPFPQPALRYLVTASGADEQAGHGLLGVLMWHAFNHHSINVTDPVGGDSSYELEVELEQLPSQIWTAFGVDPQPFFVLRVLLPHDWPTKPMPPLVLEEASLTARTIRQIQGRIMWEVEGKTQPVADAVVELLMPRLQVRTDKQGQFTFPAILPNANNRYPLNVYTPSGTIIPVVVFEPAGTNQPIKAITLTHIFGTVVEGRRRTPVANAAVTLPPPERVVDYYRRQYREANLLDSTVPDAQIRTTDVEALIPDYLRPFRTTVTDNRGRFTLLSVWRDATTRTVEIATSSTRRELSFTGNGTLNSPIEIRL